MGPALRVLVACVLGAAVAGCGDSESRPPLPQVNDRGGPVMAHPQLVPIVFRDGRGDAIQQFSQWIVTSSWLDAVGGEYGVGAGSVLGLVQRPELGPAEITDGQIVDLLYAGLADGTIPKPASGEPSDVLYLIYFPPETVITAGGSTSCVDFGGYHASARRNGVELAYAVIASCLGFISGLDELETLEMVSSHELIEAATDPFPSNRPGFQIRDRTSPWRAIGDEVADLCARGDATAVWREGAFVAQRSWSNKAAAAGEDPCVPGQQSPYFNVVAALDGVPRIRPGQRLDIQLAGFAPDAENGFAWGLSADPASAAEATVKLDTHSMNAGGKAKLTVDVAAAVPIGTTVRFFVFSGSDPYQVLPMFAVAGDPCSSFLNCQACTSHLGCGYCGETGRCAVEGPSGPADGSCPASSFETWPGSCDGLCAGHSTSCTDCASQPGCGWCASGDGPHCVEASHDYAEPAHASCAYADWSFTPAYCPG